MTENKQELSQQNVWEHTWETHSVENEAISNDAEILSI